MNTLTIDFQSLPEEYQHVIQLAQETYKITVTPLQLLVGGWSGAVVYLVSVSSNETQHVEHCILKLDRRGKFAKSDEVTRHNIVLSKSTPEFARNHIAELVFDCVGQEGAIAIFYRIAGQSLLKYRPLSKYERQNQLKTILTLTNTVLLTEWNANPTFEQAIHPHRLLEKWLGYRLNAGGTIEKFLQDSCQVNPDIAGFLISGHVFPNPLLYARKPEPWGKARSIDIATGLIHGDLNTNNILVRFAENKDKLQGYYLIDFALFNENMPLLYDQRYLEMSYLLQAMSEVSFAKCVNLLTLMSELDILDSYKAPIEMAGVSAVIGSARSAFSKWVQANHPSLHDDLWGQYWLAGVAAGLNFCHKRGLSDEQRLAGLIYATANLKHYATLFNLPRPTDVELLYEENQFGSNKPASVLKREEHKPALPSGTVTFLFTDIEGSTNLSQQYPEAMPALLARHHEILNQAIISDHEFVYEIVGDAFYVAFHNASDALAAALDIQRALRREAWLPVPIQIRIGLHTGSAQLQDASQSPRYEGYSSLAISQHIMSAGHGGQILLSQTTADLLGDKLPDGALLTDMRERRLKDVAQPVHIYQLTVPDLPAAFPPLKAEEAVNHNLPVQLTPFIGRGTQIVAIKELLQRADVHLVTLLGPGGTGKTRLSLQVAQEMLDQFRHGVFFVPLADDTNANQLISRVAQQLEVREGGRPLLENVKDFLRDKNILLVLDNFEQLISAAPIVADLLANASQLKILVSSRIALNLYGEHEFPSHHWIYLTQKMS